MDNLGKMKVAIFTGTIELNNNQTINQRYINVRQVYVTERLKYLVNYKNLELNLICPSGIKEDLKDLNINFTFYKMSKRKHFKYITSVISSFIKLLKTDCDIVHCYGSLLAESIIITQKVRRKKFKIIFEPLGVLEEELKIHSRSSWKSKILGPYLLWKSNWMFTRADGIIAYSNAMKNYFSRHHNIEPENIFFVPKGVDMNFIDDHKDSIDIDLKKLLNLEGKKLIVYTGSISELHGIRTLIKTMEFIQKLDKRIILLLVGDGPLIHHIKDFIKKKNLKNVVLIGFIPRKLISGYLRIADLLVIPHPKGSGEVDPPTKLFEYLITGKPIVASNLKAIAEVVGENAVLVEPDNPQALAEAILKILKDEKLAKKLGKNVKKIAENYSWDETARKTYDAYVKVSKGV